MDDDKGIGQETRWENEIEREIDDELPRKKVKKKAKRKTQVTIRLNRSELNDLIAAMFEYAKRDDACPFPVVDRLMSENRSSARRLAKKLAKARREVPYAWE